MSATCEICRFHPATQRVVVVEGGRKREVPVCDVHRGVAARGSEPDPANLVSVPNNACQRTSP